MQGGWSCPAVAGELRLHCSGPSCPRIAVQPNLCPPTAFPLQRQQALVTKSMPKPLGHISSLKHLIELKLEAAAGSGGSKGGEDGARFACPISGQASGWVVWPARTLQRAAAAPDLSLLALCQPGPSAGDMC